MITCTRRIQFCAGHRVMGHENKCAHLHGHNYVVFLTAESIWKGSVTLDSIGRVIDFSVLKEEIGGWIDKYWDHGFILCTNDFMVHEFLVKLNIGQAGVPQKVYLLPKNPTAENMANYLLHEICPAALFDKGIRVVEVVIWETENCHATARLEGVETHEQIEGAKTPIGTGSGPDTPIPGSGGTNSALGQETKTHTTQDGGSDGGTTSGNVISPGYYEDGGG